MNPILGNARDLTITTPVLSPAPTREQVAPQLTQQAIEQLRSQGIPYPSPAQIQELVKKNLTITETKAPTAGTPSTFSFGVGDKKQTFASMEEAIRAGEQTYGKYNPQTKQFEQPAGAPLVIRPTVDQANAELLRSLGNNRTLFDQVKKSVGDPAFDQSGNLVYKGTFTDPASVRRAAFSGDTINVTGGGNERQIKLNTEQMAQLNQTGAVIADSFILTRDAKTGSVQGDDFKKWSSNGVQIVDGKVVPFELKSGATSIPDNAYVIFRSNETNTTVLVGKDGRKNLEDIKDPALRNLIQEAVAKDSAKYSEDCPDIFDLNVHVSVPPSQKPGKPGVNTPLEENAGKPGKPGEGLGSIPIELRPFSLVDKKRIPAMPDITFVDTNPGTTPIPPSVAINPYAAQGGVTADGTGGVRTSTGILNPGGTMNTILGRAGLNEENSTQYPLRTFQNTTEFAVKGKGGEIVGYSYQIDLDSKPNDGLNGMGKELLRTDKPLTDAELKQLPKSEAAKKAMAEYADLMKLPKEQVAAAAAKLGFVATPDHKETKTNEVTIRPLQQKPVGNVSLPTPANLNAELKKLLGIPESSSGIRVYMTYDTKGGISDFTTSFNGVDNFPHSPYPKEPTDVPKDANRIRRETMSVKYNTVEEAEAKGGVTSFNTKLESIKDPDMRARALSFLVATVLQGPRSKDAPPANFTIGGQWQRTPANEIQISGDASEIIKALGEQLDPAMLKALQPSIEKLRGQLDPKVQAALDQLNKGIK